MAAPKPNKTISCKALIKEDSKSGTFESKITSHWSKIGDTNLVKFDTKKFWQPSYTSEPTATAKKMIESGIINATSFPPVVQCYELIVECAQHYHSTSRRIVAKDGTVFAYLSETAINETFHLPKPKDMAYISIEGAKFAYDDKPDACVKIIDKFWLKKSRGGRSR